MPVAVLLKRIGQRFAVILLAAGVLLVLPEPQDDSILRGKNALVVLGTIIALGKTLFDTFFFDRTP